MMEIISKLDDIWSKLIEVEKKIDVAMKEKKDTDDFIKEQVDSEFKKI